MSWTTLTQDHIKARLAYDEICAIEETGEDQGSAPRLQGILEQVTALVRAKVAACGKNTLGASGTIPEECLHAAATIAKHDLRASLPSHGGEDEGGLREREYRNAYDFLRDVASCEIGIEIEDSGKVSGRRSGCFGGCPRREF